MECGVCLEEGREEFPKHCCTFTLCTSCFQLLRKKDCPYCRRPLRPTQREPSGGSAGVDELEEEEALRTRRRQERRLLRLYFRELDHARNRVHVQIRKNLSSVRRRLLRSLVEEEVRSLQ